ncbi:arsenate reductase ArsC [Kribbella shirazensis]|uniref:Arsenate reductase n=1 Tax=Kribbella shirazensis TaxID=1105143 RepID=A0A7X5VG16_9ACTN|nr:arsenate reductase [Kribbella shirazensis]
MSKPVVLFVCVHNAGRSQMAAGWLRHLAGDSVDVRSAGSAPKDQLNPVAVEAMREVGIDITGTTPRLLDTDDVRASDVVITMGCGDTCPTFPGKRYEDWDLTDPAGQPIEVVRQVRDEIRTRIEKLVAELQLSHS